MLPPLRVVRSKYSGACGRALCRVSVWACVDWKLAQPAEGGLPLPLHSSSPCARDAHGLLGQGALSYDQRPPTEKGDESRRILGLCSSDRCLRVLTGHSHEDTWLVKTTALKSRCRVVSSMKRRGGPVGRCTRWANAWNWAASGQARQPAAVTPCGLVAGPGRETWAFSAVPL